jgi:hypothetical protein
LAIFTLKSVLRNPEAAGARQRLGYMASPLLQHEGTKVTKVHEGTAGNHAGKFLVNRTPPDFIQRHTNCIGVQSNKNMF